MITKHKVSIIIPVYNSEEFLKESIESVLSQTFSDIEIICVNDGSTDGSLEILNQFSDDISIITQQNKGLAAALNAGIEAMSGGWFKWFSPDDKMYPSAIETLVDTAKNLDESTIVYSNWEIIDETGKELRRFTESNYNPLNNFDFNVRLLDGQIINVNTTLIPAMVFSKGFRMNAHIDPVLVDYDLFLQAGLIYNMKFHLIEDSLIKYRLHSEQLSHKKIKSSLDNIVSVRESVLSKLDDDTKKQYLEAMDNYKKEKPISRKVMETGLKLISSYLPDSTTDRILVFYLNKIRRTR